MGFSQSSVSSSGELSATTQVTSTGGFLHGLELNPPSAGTATLKVYDSSVAGVTKLITTATTAAGLSSIYIEFPNPRACNSGIYVVLTGTTTYSIGYSLG